MTQVGVQPGREQRYYTALGRATDYVLRCKDCKAIVLVEDIRKYGACPGNGVTACGNKRFSEITALSEVEKASIEALDFPHKAEFLSEFSASV
jgi:hypothetical protein